MAERERMRPTFSKTVDVNRLSPALIRHLFDEQNAPEGVAEARFTVGERATFLATFDEIPRPMTFRSESGEIVEGLALRAPSRTTFFQRGALLLGAMLLRDHPDEFADIAREMIAFGTEGELALLANAGRRYDLALAVLAIEAAKDDLARDARNAATLEKSLEKHMRGFSERVAAVPTEARILDGSAPLWLDEALAGHLDKIGTEAAKEAARSVREGANEAAKAYRADGDAIRWLEPWLADLPDGEAGVMFVGALPAVRNLAQFVWRDEVRPGLEAKQRKASAAVRISTELARTVAQGRAYGGRRDETNDSQILVEQPMGMTLALPFDAVHGAIQRSTGLVKLRDALTGRAMRTYLATLALYQDVGMREDGSFELEGPGAILDLIGASKRRDIKGGRTYERFASKDTRAVKEDLESFRRFRVRVVGDLEAAAGDPLLDEIRDRRSGRVVTYAHSRLIVGALRSAFAQIPRASIRLPADDVPYGIGIALVSRQRFLAALAKGRPLEAPIRDWLEAAGVNIAEGRRKHGRDFWTLEAARLARVAEEGGFGRIAQAGDGEEMTLTLAPAEQYKAGHLPLLESSKAAQRVEKAAKVADRRKQLPPNGGGGGK